MANIRKKTAGKIVLVVGIGFLAWSGYTYSKASASSGWPSTQGEVVVSMVDKTTQTTNSNVKWIYQPILKYDYEIDGVAYSGDRIRFTSFSISHKKEHKAKREISAYPVGKSVQVFYNPQNPSDSVLETGVGSRVYMGFGVGILMLFVGSIMAKLD